MDSDGNHLPHEMPIRFLDAKTGALENFMPISLIEICPKGHSHPPVFEMNQSTGSLQLFCFFCGETYIPEAEKQRRVSDWIRRIDGPQKAIAGGATDTQKSIAAGVIIVSRPPW
jgi:hypothetical protein